MFPDGDFAQFDGEARLPADVPVAHLSPGVTVPAGFVRPMPAHDFAALGNDLAEAVRAAPDQPALRIGAGGIVDQRHHHGAPQFSRPAAMHTTHHVGDHSSADAGRSRQLTHTPTAAAFAAAATPRRIDGSLISSTQARQSSGCHKWYLSREARLAHRAHNAFTVPRRPGRKARTVRATARCRRKPGRIRRWSRARKPRGKAQTLRRCCAHRGRWSAVPRPAFGRLP